MRWRLDRLSPPSAPNLHFNELFYVFEKKGMFSYVSPDHHNESWFFLCALNLMTRFFPSFFASDVVGSGHETITTPSSFLWRATDSYHSILGAPVLVLPRAVVIVVTQVIVAVAWHNNSSHLYGQPQNATGPQSAFL